MFGTQRGTLVREVSGRPPSLALLQEAIAEVLGRRRLIRYLVLADMKKRGSDTVLGNLWWVLDPLLQMVVYVVFVTIIAPRHQPDYPLFIFAAILPWKWYTSVVTDSVGAVVNRARLIRQIAFPKITLPLAVTTADTFGFAWGLIPLFGLMVFFADRISLMLLWIPVIAVVQYVFSVATAVLLSAANVFFRDLGNIAGHLLRLWWFLSPSLYSLSQLDTVGFIHDRPWIQALAQLNPFAVLFEAYRAVIYGTPDGIGRPHPPDLLSLAELLVASVVLFGLVSIFFKRVEPDFAKVLS